MSRINVLEKHQLDSETSDTLNAVEKKLGMVPNLFSTLAHAPVALAGYLTLSDNLSKGLLSARQRELVSLAVAQFNQCQYCLSAHQAIGKGVGLSEDDIRMARLGQAESQTDDNIAAFAKEVVESNGMLSQASFISYIDKGLTHSQMIETIANVSLNVFSNYVNLIADTQIDFPVASLDIDNG